MIYYLDVKCSMKILSDNIHSFKKRKKIGCWNIITLCFNNHHHQLAANIMGLQASTNLHHSVLSHAVVLISSTVGGVSLLINLPLYCG